jgi:hypothetical protein
MAEEAGSKGVPAPVVALVKQLEGLGSPAEEGADPAGAEEAMFAIHQAAVVIKYLQRRLR